MRFALAGTFLLAITVVCFAPTPAAAQEVKGEVESIGFGSLYRPNCWTPMVVRLHATKSGTYQIRVKQEDLDRDIAEFTETISLTGSDEGNTQEQRFWMYFIPQPTAGGLMDTTRGGTLRELQQELHVFVCDKSGKEISELPVTSTITDLDNFPGGYHTNVVRGNRLVVAVLDAGQPVWKDYQSAVGTMEDVVMIGVQPRELPEDVRGYQAVDELLWLNAPAPDPANPSDERRYRAIEDYVRQGGSLVICQPPQRDAGQAWGEMMPVVVKDIVNRESAEPLASMALGGEHYDYTDPNARGREAADRAAWAGVTGPFRVARAVAKPGTLVDAVIHWNNGKNASKQAGDDVSPYFVREPLGAGCVTWVAQDLSDPMLTHPRGEGGPLPGWPHIWDRVFDWKNDTTVMPSNPTKAERKPYAITASKDLGAALDGLMELTAKSRTLVLIAALFFIAYWVVAGPAIYFFLNGRKRAELSWFLFGASAIAATALTVLVVKLVVRGAPELSHVTFVREAPGQPALAISRMGLYIPQDGNQEIALRNTAPNHVSYLTAFPIHPKHVTADTKFPAQLPYVVPVREAGATAPTALSVPYRSTLKKFEAHWVGRVTGGLDGTAQLVVLENNSILEGQLGNRTGKDLKNVYFVYRDLTASHDEDEMFYLPIWKKDRVVDLQKEFFQDRPKFVGDKGATPDDHIKLQYILGRPGQDYGWTRYWYSALRGRDYVNMQWSDPDGRVRKSIPMLSLFDRLPPMRNFPNIPDRVDLLRRGAREYDISSAVCAGNLVIIAEADGSQPLPFPLEVDGQRVAGHGAVIYQFVVPLQRSRQALITTQPSILGSRTRRDKDHVASAHCVEPSQEIVAWR